MSSKFASGARGAAEALGGGGDGALAVDRPQVAHRRGLDVLRVLEQTQDVLESTSAVADARVAEQQPVVGALDARVGARRRGERGGPGHGAGGLSQEASTVHAVSSISLSRAAHAVQPRASLRFRR